MKKYLLICMAVLALLLSLSPALLAQDDCYATGDINGDGITFSVADMVYLIRSLNGEVLDSFVAYEADLNGDCMIDDLDLDIYQCFFDSGMICLPPGYPLQTCCEPSLVRGSCCFPPDSCKLLSEENCASALGEFVGEYACNMDRCCCDLPGDVNNDGFVNILDILYILDYLYRGGPIPPCWAEAMVGGTNVVNILEITYLIAYLYKGGPDPICGNP